jgi:drug/metabolite transporter (DMT)-like permease
MTSDRLSATLTGSAAIAMWASLALFATGAREVPPFQLVAMTLAIGAALGAASWPFRPGAARALRAPAEVWALGVFGLFGYHFFYFTALRLAPPVEANLLNYLWPLLIVLLSALLPGERLRPRHIVGALLGLAGAALVVTRGGGLDARLEHLPGYAAAVVCAVVWASYSVLSRRFGAQPTDTVAGFCAASAALALVCHLLFETTVWPSSAWGWASVLLLGMGPTGLAFYAWDRGMKHGDIQALGALSYLAPVGSTLLLVAFGFGEPGLGLWLALALVVAGAVAATWKRA